MVITIRLLTYWNSKRIAAEMERRQIYRVDHDTIDRLLAAKGCGAVLRCVSVVLATSAPDPTSSGISTSRAPFFIRLAALASRPGLSPSSTTTPAVSSACAFTPTHKPHPS